MTGQNKMYYFKSSVTTFFWNVIHLEQCAPINHLKDQAETDFLYLCCIMCVLCTFITAVIHWRVARSSCRLHIIKPLWFQWVSFLQRLLSSRPSHGSVYFCGLFFHVPGKKRNTQSPVHITAQEIQLQPLSWRSVFTRCHPTASNPWRSNITSFHNFISSFLHWNVENISGFDFLKYIYMNGNII